MLKIIPFIFQDAVQGYHWNNSQATLHPVVLYHREGNEVFSSSYCFISDHLKHDANAVHAFLTCLLKEIKNQLPNVSKCLYFSDGAVAQYKNYKNLSNLCHHMSDHGLEAEWHFFATSHGKSPCDGIGGTVKRLASRASLQMVSGKCISISLQMFNWCCENVSGIKFFHITTTEVQAHTKLFKLEERYKLSQLIPGTRSFHSFIPFGVSDLRVRTISFD